MIKKATFLFFGFLIILFLVACYSNDDTAVTEESTSQLSTEYETDFTETSTQIINEEITLSESEIPGNATLSQRSFYGENTGTEKTVTGFEPLEKIDFTKVLISDKSHLSGEMISHSYGVATDEKPHSISVGYQKLFDEKLFDAICYDSHTEKKVVYLTFDCGYENGYTSRILDVLKEKDVKAAFFCTLPQMKDNKELIARMITEGHIVGNHSVTHPNFSALSEAEIIEEIKGFDDYIRENFGYSSLFFRFPEGKYSEKTLSVINDIGYKCVFWSLAYADWDTTSQKGAMHAYETVLSRLHPGAVILLHSVSSDNAEALADIIDTARLRGYEFCSLEDL